MKGIDNEYINENPCKKIKIIKKLEKEKEYCTIEEAQEILDLMADEPLKYLLFHVLAFFC